MVLSKLPTRRYFVTIFVIVLALFMIFSLVIYHHFREAQRLDEWTAYNYETSRLGRKLLLDLVDMETGVRGYLLTGNRSFLEPYLKSSSSIRAQAQYLSEFTRDEGRTRAIISAWLHDIEKISKQLDKQVRDMQNGDEPTKESLHQQRAQMDKIRGSLESYISERLQILRDQRKVAGNSQKNFKYVLIVGTIMATGSTLLAIMIILTLLNRSRQAEEQSRSLEQRFITIMAGINDGVFDLNLLTKEIYYSSSYKSMLGYADDEFVNTQQASWDIMHSEDTERARAVLQAYVTGESDHYTNIFRMQHKEGHWVWIMSRAVGIRDAQGMIVRLIGTHTDITDQKKREEELAALNTEMEAFTYIASHDLRAPLVNLRGFAKEIDHAVTRISPLLESHRGDFTAEEWKLLQESITLDMVDSLRFIEQSVSKMDALTTAVLDLSRIGKRVYRVELVDVGQIVQRCLDTQAYEINQKNITITCGEMPHIQTDPLALEQVLSNIIDNAVKYLDPARPGVIRIEATQSGKEVILSIADNGRGIATDDKEKVFQLFRRARNSQDVRGMGMGMPYVQVTVRKLSGAIWFTSEINEGTTFYIRLPKHLVIKKGSTL